METSGNGSLVEITDAWLGQIGMSRNKLGAILGASASATSYWFNGEIKKSRTFTKAKLAHFFGVDVEAFEAKPQEPRPDPSVIIQTGGDEWIEPNKRQCVKKRLQAWLEYREVKAADVARSGGIGSGVISGLVTGKTVTPDMNSIKGIAKGLNLSVAQFIEGPPKPPKKIKETTAPEQIEPPSESPMKEKNMGAGDLISYLMDEYKCKISVDKFTDGETKILFERIEIKDVMLYAGDIQNDVGILASEIEYDGEHYTLIYIFNTEE